MSDIKQPTCDDLFDGDGFEKVQQTSEIDGYDAVEDEVHRRESDGTFWRVAYRRSLDNDTHGLRDGDASIFRVYPHEVTAIEYREKP